MSKLKITGSFVALITPFNRDGSVDFGAFRTLLKFQEDNGTAAILIMGSTGETSMLTPDETFSRAVADGRQHHCSAEHQTYDRRAVGTERHSDADLDTTLEH